MFLRVDWMVATNLTKYKPFAAAILLLSVIFSVVLPVAPPVAAQVVDPVIQQLSDTYAPIAVLRDQTAPCDKEGEGYFPASIDWIFDNPDIRLRADAGGDAAGDPVLVDGFTPADLATAGPGAYIDFPNDPQHPGCLYERFFKTNAGRFGFRPTTYVHVVIDEGKRRLYLQYWFWYLFNDWNNLHESDWEMVQLVFDTANPADALAFGPDEIGFAQHESGQIVRWSDHQIERDGTHPIVYPGAGSHATYPSADLFISWGEHGSGFGCDNTTSPGTPAPLQAVVIPDPVDPAGPFAWTLFQGRWGQRGQPLFNGPLGPNMNEKWLDPAGSMSDWTTGTLSVPQGPSLGLEATGTFCSLTRYSSQVVAQLIDKVWAAVLLGVVALSLIAFCIYRIWPYLLEALDIYGNELATFLGIGLLAIPIGFLFNLIVQVLADYSPFDQVLGWLSLSGGAAFTVTSIVGGLQQAAMLLVVVPAVVQAMKHIRRGQRPTVRGSYRASITHFGTLLTAWIIYFALLASVGFTIVALPFAIYFGVTMQFFIQAVVLEHEKPGWNALVCSWRITRSQLVRTLSLSIGFLIIAVLPGPVVGLTFLILGGSRVQFANLASGFLYALLIPYAYIGLTMAWRRLCGDPIIEPQMMTHRATRTRDVELPGTVI
ncbi:MAG: hypothetical protein E6R14_08400 [Thermomicrobiales bacterium]|nr:MAG: hypothetical protein E6R14_08400 [Thermomicrobiales bacterium]